MGADEPVLPDYLMALVMGEAGRAGYRCLPVGRHQFRLHGPGRADDSVIDVRSVRAKADRVHPDSWGALAADFISSLMAGYETPELNLSDFDVVCPLLRTRLYPWRTADNESRVTAPIAPGIVEALLVDEVFTVGSLHPQDIATWPLNHRELFDLAQVQTRADGGLNTRVVSDGRDEITTLTGNDDYASAHALWLDEYPEAVGPWGALLVVPHEGVIMTHPIRGATVKHGMDALCKVGHSAFVGSERPIMPWVYLWRNGRIDIAAWTGGHGRDLDVYPTDAYKALLNEMGAPGRP